MVGNPQIGAEVKLNLVGFKQGFTTEVEAVKQPTAGYMVASV